MKLITIKCPDCGSNIGEFEIEVGTKVQCPYCKTLFFVEDENTKTLNINIKNSTVDETEIFKEKIRQEELKQMSKSEKKFFFIVLLIAIFACVFYGSYFVTGSIKKSIAQANGMICPGSSFEFVEKNHSAVVKKLKKLGFKNIEEIDMHEGILIINDGDVTEISINGRKFFGQFSAFKPDAKIIISHK